MNDIILCIGCGSEIYDFENRLTNEYGDWHFDCWSDEDDDDDDD